MKLARLNHNRSIQLSKSEMLAIAGSHNANTGDLYSLYDLEELSYSLEEKITIWEADTGITENGFIMFKEDFEALFDYYGAAVLDDNVVEITTPVDWQPRFLEM